ncbi:hypothetical protein [Methylobacter sp. YRD-M1]|uniref:hypothetical protein n=1 Tax=Methylobacter sp. YRD-M1 TaxID=2911520 RepID=UPI00227A0E2D|nr:hypothetical protein [Methylobacter sp. YRD-M1]WAK02402.1 hypothetical protein LZ558_01055 [Methylobacter sp. YRD-M1]
MPGLSTQPTAAKNCAARHGKWDRVPVVTSIKVAPTGSAGFSSSAFTTTALYQQVLHKQQQYRINRSAGTT